MVQVEKGAKLVSPVHTDDDGDTWQTTLYPTGDTEADRGDRMAIYLAAPNCDQLRGPGWWKSVRYRVSLVDTNSTSQKLKVCYVLMLFSIKLRRCRCSLRTEIVMSRRLSNFL